MNPLEQKREQLSLTTMSRPLETSLSWPDPSFPDRTEYDLGIQETCGTMSRSKHTEAQMIAAVKQMEAGRKAEDVAREVGVSAHTIYAWKSKYGGMDVSEAQEAKRLRDENSRLRKLAADLSLDKEALQSVIEKNGWSSQR
jgi:putative transposase